MKEYIALGHMKPVPVTELPLPHNYIIPHRTVLRPSSSTMKLRVIFNFSCKTGQGISLNNVLMVGSKTQSELFDLLVLFRSYQFAFTCDMEKMYCQVLVDPRDCSL